MLLGFREMRGNEEGGALPSPPQVLPWHLVSPDVELGVWSAVTRQVWVLEGSP